MNDIDQDPISIEPTTIEAKTPADEVLDLEDKFIENAVESTVVKTEHLKSSEIKAESSSMPHVLVDEELMNEIAAIPDRFGFKIGDVADLLGIKQYVLRYWEQEFELLKPKKASNNQRLFTKKDVENAFLIRKLLYRDKFSIEGARQALKDVKFAFKKEKDFNSVVQKIDYIQLQIRGFADDVRKAKALFS
ncbi:MAG: MerR family transcriptional regulator [Bdellovibrionaceae bacterium]|nr:MerR family transcriptional regulator [Pseudobdellovibrionaceae bacterium]